MAEDNCLQQLRKWAEWEGKQAVAALHSVLMGFYPAHKSTLCNSKLPVVECVFFLACHGVFAFFCKYHDRKKRMQPSGTDCVGRNNGQCS